MTCWSLFNYINTDNDVISHKKFITNVACFEKLLQYSSTDGQTRIVYD